MKKIALILIILIGIGLIVVFMDNSKKEENNQQTQPVINEQNNQVTPKEENNQQAQPVQEPQKEENKQNIQDNQSVPTEQIEEKKPKTKVEKLKDLSSKGDAKEYIKKVEDLTFGYAAIIGEVIPRSLTPIIIH